MPVERGKDKNGCWIRWGKRGTKHHYKCGDKTSLERAKKKVDEDRRRIEYFKRQ